MSKSVGSISLPVLYKWVVFFLSCSYLKICDN